MGKTEKALAIMHEAGVLCCMLLFVISGALLMLRYANDGDFLPVLAGFVCMGIGAGVMLRPPGLLRRLKQGDEELMDENDAYEAALLRVQSR